MIKYKRNLKKYSLVALMLTFLIFSLMIGNYQVKSDKDQDIKVSKDSLSLQTLASSYSLSWNKSYATPPSGLDDSLGMYIDSDGTIYLAGQINTSGTIDIFVGKYDSNGNPLQNTTWDGLKNDYAYDVVLDSQKNIYVIGVTEGADMDVVLLKFNSVFGYEWNETIDFGGNGEQGVAIAIDYYDNDYIYIGGFYDSGGMNNDVFVRKYSTDKVQQWQRAWDSTGSSDTCNGIALYRSAPYTYIYVTGNCDMVGLSSQAFLFKLRNDDNLAPTANNVSWGGTSTEQSNDIGIDADGNIYLTGITSSFGFGGGDIFITKYDSDMINLWNRTWGGDGGENNWGISVSDNGDILVAGSTTSFEFGSWDVFGIKFDTNGYQTWQAVWGGPSSDRGYAIRPFGNHIYLTGSSKSFGATTQDIILLKYSMQTPSPDSFLFTTEFFIGLVIGAGIGIVIILTALFAISRRNKLPDSSVETTKPKPKITSIKRK